MSEDNVVWRAQTYALLAHLLSSEPDQTLIDSLAAIEVTEPESPMGKHWLNLIEQAKKADVEAIYDAFQALFIGVTHGELIPYGSYYQTGFLMEEPLAEIRTDLGKLGLERQQDTSEPEDHIAAVCDVMRLILSAEGTPIVTADEFFKHHALPWFPAFFNDLAASKQHEFYSALGQFGAAFTELEQRIFSAN
jgi:TorA maturation chaperone TorD